MLVWARLGAGGRLKGVNRRTSTQIAITLRMRAAGLVNTPKVLRAVTGRLQKKKVAKMSHR